MSYEISILKKPNTTTGTPDDVYPVTSVDAVVDGEGNTVAELLDEKISSTTVSGQSSTPTFPFVEYASQSLTTAEKQQARSNIGAEESGTCLPLTGGTVNGNVNINGSNGWTANASSSVTRVSEAHTDGYGLAIQSTSSSSDVYLLNAVYGQNTLGYGGTSAFVINANGNVGIGTESPSAKLDINGQGKMTGIQYRRDVIQPRTTGWYTFYEMGTSTEHRYVKFFIHKSWGSQSNLAVLGEVIVQTFNTVAYKDIHQIGGGISVRVVSGEWKNRTYLQFRDAYATEDYRIFTEGTGEQVYPTLEDTVPSGYIAIEL